MTAGRGIAHSEESRGDFAAALGGLLALDGAARRGEERCASFRSSRGAAAVDGQGAEAIVAMGRLGAAISPARAFSPLVAAEIRLHGGATSIPLDPSWEHAIYAVEEA